MKKLSSILDKTHLQADPHLHTEFQVFGAYLAEQLEDLKHCSLYIKLAKTLDRNMLLEALNYTKDYTAAKSKGKIFMWKLQQLKKELKT